MLLELEEITKSYKFGSSVLKGINLSVAQGEMLAVMGKSGCGKSTLLNILGGLTRPDTGEYRYQGQRLLVNNTRAMNQFRKENISFILQDFALLQERTAIQNVELPLRARGIKAGKRRELAAGYLKAMGIYDELAQSCPQKMSGGEQQRVAIARALVVKPKILLADEPTGALDEENTSEILKLLQKISEDGVTIILVTHDESVAKCCDRTVRIMNGKLVEDEKMV